MHIDRRNPMVAVRGIIINALVRIAAGRINRNFIAVFPDLARAARLSYRAENVEKAVYAFLFTIAGNGIKTEKSRPDKARLRR